MRGCIETWRTLLPDYTIILWTDSLLDCKSSYAKNALNNANWGNLGNLLRYAALYTYGGIYLDVDIQVVRSFDPLLNNQCFLGCQSSSPLHWLANSAVMGSVQGHWFLGYLLKTLLEKYTGNENPSISGVHLPSKALIEFGLLKYRDVPQVIDDIVLLPTRYFHPIPYNKKVMLACSEQTLSADTYCVHHWTNSWNQGATYDAIPISQKPSPVSRILGVTRRLISSTIHQPLPNLKGDSVIKEKNVPCFDFKPHPLLVL